MKTDLAFKLVSVFLAVLGVNYLALGAKLSYRDCREERLHLREDTSDVIVTGTVEKVDRHADDQEYGAQIIVKRVIKYPKPEAGFDARPGKVIRVEGFGNEAICDHHIKVKDSRVFLLKISSKRQLRLNATLLRITVPNLERIAAVVKGETYKRSIINEEPCEKKYCPHNGDCKVDKRTGQAECECLTRCPVGYQPVCGSNGATYPNECQLRRDSCSKKLKIHVKHPGACLIPRS